MYTNPAPFLPAFGPIVGDDILACHAITGWTQACHTITGWTQACHTITGWTLACHAVTGWTQACHTIAGWTLLRLVLRGLDLALHLLLPVFSRDRVQLSCFAGSSISMFEPQTVDMLEDLRVQQVLRH